VILAHLFGMPVEEMLVPLAGSVGAGTIFWVVGTVKAQWKIKRARFYRR